MEKNYEITVRQIVDGCVEVRNTLVRKALLNKRNIVAYYNDEKMTIDEDILIFTNRSTSPEKVSKLTGASYRMYRYPWIPDKPKQ